ncbi:MAG: extracellular solute-binding protein, partial [Clostridia bacterium]|nr:extracellular solute-binding protein [Clostridia bacterium]
MKITSKLVVILSIFTILAMAFSGCGGSKKERTETDGKSFTYWATMDANSQRTLSSYSDMMFWQEMEKSTGVHIDFIHPIEGSTGNEAFIAMLSGGELPDMVEYNWSGYTGGPQQAIDDEVIIALDSYLEEHAPNFYNYTEGEYGKAHDYAYKLEATTDDGHYYGFNVLNLGETKGFAGIYVRADLLEKWGMDIPETIDDWTAVFAKAKSEGFSKPFTSTCDALSFKSYSTNTFNTAYDVGKNLYLEGDKVVFGPLQPGFKEYLAQLAEWSKAGYIDHGFVTAEGADIQSNMTNGNSIAAYGYVGSALGVILPAAQERIAGFDLVACPHPVLKEGQIPRFQAMVKAATPHAIGITTECGNYEKAIEWCDYLYSEDGMELQLFGVEGDTYTIEEKDGEKFYTYTDKILDFKANGFNSVEESLYHFVLPCNHPGYNQHRDYLNGFYQHDRQKEAINVWNKWSDEAVKYSLPTLSYTEEESRENTDILEIAQTNLDVAICDIIIGRRDVSTYD